MLHGNMEKKLDGLLKKVIQKKKAGLLFLKT
jgi:hypothetical protein